MADSDAANFEQCSLYALPSVIICQPPPPFFVSLQSDSSRSGKFYLPMNSAPPPAVASSSGGAHIHQTNGELVRARGYNTSKL